VRAADSELGALGATQAALHQTLPKPEAAAEHAPGHVCVPCGSLQGPRLHVEERTRDGSQNAHLQPSLRGGTEHFRPGCSRDARLARRVKRQQTRGGGGGSGVLFRGRGEGPARPQLVHRLRPAGLPGQGPRRCVAGRTRHPERVGRALRGFRVSLSKSEVNATWRSPRSRPLRADSMQKGHVAPCSFPSAGLSQ